MANLRRTYLGYELIIEPSGNVSVYINNVFYDKYANMSEAKDRIHRLIERGTAC